MSTKNALIRISTGPRATRPAHNPAQRGRLLYSQAATPGDPGAAGVDELAIMDATGVRVIGGRALLGTLPADVAQLQLDVAGKQDEVGAGVTGQLLQASGTAGTIQIKTATTGSANLPIFLNAGVPTALTQAGLQQGVFGTAAIGTSARPIHIAANGVATARTVDVQDGIIGEADATQARILLQPATSNGQPRTIAGNSFITRYKGQALAGQLLMVNSDGYVDVSDPASPPDIDLTPFVRTVQGDTALTGTPFITRHANRASSAWVVEPDGPGGFVEGIRSNNNIGASRYWAGLIMGGDPQSVRSSHSIGDGGMTQAARRANGFRLLSDFTTTEEAEEFEARFLTLEEAYTADSQLQLHTSLPGNVSPGASKLAPWVSGAVNGGTLSAYWWASTISGDQIFSQTSPNRILPGPTADVPLIATQLPGYAGGAAGPYTPEMTLEDIQYRNTQFANMRPTGFNPANIALAVAPQVLNSGAGATAANANLVNPFGPRGQQFGTGSPDHWHTSMYYRRSDGQLWLSGHPVHYPSINGLLARDVHTTPNIVPTGTSFLAFLNANRPRATLLATATEEAAVGMGSTRRFQIFLNTVYTAWADRIVLPAGETLIIDMQRIRESGEWTLVTCRNIRDGITWTRVINSAGVWNTPTWLRQTNNTPQSVNTFGAGAFAGTHERIISLGNGSGIMRNPDGSVTVTIVAGFGAGTALGADTSFLTLPADARPGTTFFCPGYVDIRTGLPAGSTVQTVPGMTTRQAHLPGTVSVTTAGAVMLHDLHLAATVAGFIFTQFTFRAAAPTPIV